MTTGNTQLDANTIRIIFDSVSVFTLPRGALSFLLICVLEGCPLFTDGLTGGEISVNTRGILDDLKQVLKITPND